MTRRVLIVDDDECIRSVLSGALAIEGFLPEAVATLESLFCALDRSQFDVILLDLYLGEHDCALQSLEVLARRAPQSKIIVMTAHGTIATAVEAIKRGATSFVEKPIAIPELIAEIRQHLPTEPTFAPKAEALAEMGLIGRSPAMMEAYGLLDRVSASDTTTLIRGESGTGKEIVAHAIHRMSSRAGQRFEAINCAAIPETLIESELFGHMKGAFTDARTDKKGLFELCSQGTLFLDEVGDLPLGLQAKLLRVLQEKEVMPLGAGRTVRIGTRVLAATNRSLKELVAARKFREDLYYRLSVFEIVLPPLRERGDDIALIAQSFLDRFGGKLGRAFHALSGDVLSRLKTYDWPGNVRELANVIECATLLSDSARIETHHLRIPTTGPVHTNAPQGDAIRPWSEVRGTQERDYLHHLMVVTRGNISLAAKLSGKFRADLYRSLERYTIDPSHFRSVPVAAVGTRALGEPY